MVGVGLLAGVMSGLLGVGGGIIIVPAAIFLFGATSKVAVGTSLAAILPTVLISASRHAMMGNVDWKLVGYIVAGSVVGAFAGTSLINVVPDLWLRRTFAVLLVATAVKMIYR